MVENLLIVCMTANFFKVHPSFVSKTILFANLYENEDHWILLFLDWGHFEVRKDRPFQNMTLWQDKFRAQASAGLFFLHKIPHPTFSPLLLVLKNVLAVFFPGLYSMRQNWSVLKICKRKMLCFSILDNVITEFWDFLKKNVALWKNLKFNLMFWWNLSQNNLKFQHLKSTWCLDKIYHKTNCSFDITVKRRPVYLKIL